MAVSGVVDSMVGRAVRDQAFRANFLQSPLNAAEQAGYALSGEDRTMLAKLDGQKAQAFFTKMDEETPMAWCSDHACYEVEKEHQTP